MLLVVCDDVALLEAHMSIVVVTVTTVTGSITFGTAALGISKEVKGFATRSTKFFNWVIEANRPSSRGS